MFKLPNALIRLFVLFFVFLLLSPKKVVCLGWQTVTMAVAIVGSINRNGSRLPLWIVLT